MRESKAAGPRAWMCPGLLAAAVFAAPAQGGSLPALGQPPREIPFETVDLRPMIPARVGATPGRLMFDLGTPDDLFLNRHALALDAGRPAGGGFRGRQPPGRELGHDALVEGPRGHGKRLFLRADPLVRRLRREGRDGEPA